MNFGLRMLPPPPRKRERERDRRTDGLTNRRKTGKMSVDRGQTRNDLHKTCLVFFIDEFVYLLHVLSCVSLKSPLFSIMLNSSALNWKNVLYFENERKS